MRTEVGQGATLQGHIRSNIKLLMDSGPGFNHPNGLLSAITPLAVESLEYRRLPTVGIVSEAAGFSTQAESQCAAANCTLAMART